MRATAGAIPVVVTACNSWNISRNLQSEDGGCCAVWLTWPQVAAILLEGGANRGDREESVQTGKYYQKKQTPYEYQSRKKFFLLNVILVSINRNWIQRIHLNIWIVKSGHGSRYSMNMNHIILQHICYQFQVKIDCFTAHYPCNILYMVRRK